MPDIAELSVVVQGRDAGLSALLQRVETSLRATDATAQRSNAETLRLASGYSRLASALGQPAAGAEALRSTLSGLSNVDDKVALSTQATIARLEQQAAKMGEVRTRAESFKESLNEVATTAIGFTSGIEVATKVAESFKEAFNFKAELDATTASVNIQLQSIRDSGQVWQEAQAYAQTYKLTQEETSNTVRASVAIWRSSQSSVSDTFSVLQRLSVLAPGKTIEDAAFSVKELASGDITSIAEQFEISRAKAYEMRDAINGGADVIKVLDSYLNSVGVGMDTLKVKTQGVQGAQKDLLIQQEQLKLAQAEWAQGPGLAILQAQINATRGATRLLSGDFRDMGLSLGQGLQQGGPFVESLARSFGLTGTQAAVAGKALQDWVAQSGAAGAASSVAERANASYEAGLDSLGQALTAGAISQEQYQAAIIALNEQRDRAIAGASAQAGAEQQAAAGHTQVSAAVKEAATSLGEEAQKKQESADKTTALNGLQSTLASLGAAVSGKLITNAQAASYLASQYGFAANQASLLVAEQARIAGGNARLAAGAANTTDLLPGGTGFNSPGRQGTSDVNLAIQGYQQAKKDAEAAARAEKEYQLAIAGRSERLRILRSDLAKTTVGSAEYYSISTKIAQEEKSGAKAGAGTADKLGAAQTDFYQKSEDAERAHQQKLADIAADYAEKRAAAERQFAQTQLDDRAGFYERLANVKDPKQAQALSAEYEQAVQKAQEIGRTVGADAGEAYLKAREEAIQKESATKQKIAELESDETADGTKKSKAQKEQDAAAAEYQRGVLRLQQDADNARLKAIEEGGSAIAGEYDRQYRAEEKAYEEHLDRQMEIYDRKVNKITKGKGSQAGLLPPPPGQGTDDTAGAGGAGRTGAGAAAAAAAGAPTASSGQPMPVEDIATPPAIDAQTSALVGALNALKDEFRNQIGSLRGDVQSLKNSKAFQGG